MFDFDIIKSNTLLGESGFYLNKTNEIVFLDLLQPSIIFYSIENRTLTKEKLSLPKPLGNIYPLENGKFIISCFNNWKIFTNCFPEIFVNIINFYFIKSVSFIIFF